jgi:hypothetical protein
VGTTGTRVQRYYLGKNAMELSGRIQKKGILGQIIGKICWPVTRLDTLHGQDRKDVQHEEEQ